MKLKNTNYVVNMYIHIVCTQHKFQGVTIIGSIRLKYK